MQMFDIWHSNRIKQKPQSRSTHRLLLTFIQACLQTGAAHFPVNLLLSPRWQPLPSQSQVMYPSVKMASAQTTDDLSKYFPLNYLWAVLSCGSHKRETMKKKAIKPAKLKMVFYATANKGLYFPAEDVTSVSFCRLLLWSFPYYAILRFIAPMSWHNGLTDGVLLPFLRQKPARM